MRPLSLTAPFGHPAGLVGNTGRTFRPETCPAVQWDPVLIEAGDSSACLCVCVFLVFILFNAGLVVRTGIVSRSGHRLSKAASLEDLIFASSSANDDVVRRPADL